MADRGVSQIYSCLCAGSHKASSPSIFEKEIQREREVVAGSGEGERKGKKKKIVNIRVYISSPNILPDNKKIKRKEMIGMKEILYKSNISIDLSSVKKRKKTGLKLQRQSHSTGA